MYLLIEPVTSNSELPRTCTHRLVKLNMCSTTAVVVQDALNRVKLNLKAETLGVSVDELIEEAAGAAKQEIWKCIEGLWLRQDVEATMVWEVKERVRTPPTSGGRHGIAVAAGLGRYRGVNGVGESFLCCALGGGW